MEFQGLSTDQAPPIWVPLKFFITAPFFGVLFGLFVFFTPSELFLSRFSVESIIATHLLTIGFFGFVMVGALTQMLPVLAGAKIPKPKLLSTASHLLLVFGVLSFSVGFYINSSIILAVASALLGGGFFIILFGIALAINGVNNLTPTIKGMRISVSFAIAIAFMGVYLLYGYIAKDIDATHLSIANIHSVWAIFGFAGILIVSVSFQVLPMFYVAPHFKSFCKKRVVNIIAFALIFWMVLNLFGEFDFLAKFVISLFFFAFATTAWIKLNKRRRPISDVTIWYWRTSSISLAIGVLVWFFGELILDEYILLASIFIGGGFIMSIMVGMLYKIIPFLVWFHLNASGYMSIPTINEMIDKRYLKVQFYLFIISLLGFVASFFYLPLLKVFALCFIFSMALLQYNIVLPVRLYVKTKKTKPDFDMSMFGDIK